MMASVPASHSFSQVIYELTDDEILSLNAPPQRDGPVQNRIKFLELHYPCTRKIEPQQRSFAAYIPPFSPTTPSLPISYLNFRKRNLSDARPLREKKRLKTERSSLPPRVKKEPREHHSSSDSPSASPNLREQNIQRRRKRRIPRRPPGKGRALDKRLRMHCSHCLRDFWAKPTCREGRYVLNHKCSNQPRRQYVVGGWHRKCNLNHYAPCIDFVAHGEEQDDKQSS